MTELPHHSHSTISWQQRFWLAVLLICISGGGLRLYLNHQHRSATAAWNARAKALETAHHAARGRMHASLQALYKQRKPPKLTLEEAEQALNHGKPFILTPRRGSDSNASRYDWVDAGTGATWMLEFRNNRLCGWGSTSSVSIPPAPTRSPFDLATEKARRLFAGSFSLGIGTAAWLVLLVLYFPMRAHRENISHGLLALTVLCGTAWLVSPNYTLPWGIVSNDMLAWGLIMLFVSLGLYSYARRKSDDPTPRCTGCQYDLTGNVTGVCPECGLSIVPATSAAVESAPEPPC